VEADVRLYRGSGASAIGRRFQPEPIIERLTTIHRIGHDGRGARVTRGHAEARAERRLISA